MANYRWKNQQLQKVSKVFGLKATARKLIKIKISKFKNFVQPVGCSKKNRTIVRYNHKGLIKICHPKKKLLCIAGSILRHNVTWKSYMKIAVFSMSKHPNLTQQKYHFQKKGDLKKIIGYRYIFEHNEHISKFTIIYDSYKWCPDLPHLVDWLLVIFAPPVQNCPT